MPLKIQKSSGSGEGYMGDGIFIDLSVVKSVTDVTEEENERSMQLTNPYKRDVVLKIIVQLSKNDWERRITIGGSFTRDGVNNNVTDWGGAFKIRDFFLACGVVGETDENDRFSEELMRQTLNCEIIILSYRNTNNKTSTWTQVASVEREKESFKQYFLKQAAKGFPNNYSPHQTVKGNNEADLSGPWDDDKTISADML